MNPWRLNGGALVMIESEGLAPIVNSCGSLLAAHGLDKHGSKAWKALDRRALARKMLSHFIRGGVDADGGFLHATNGSTRALMLGQAVLGSPGEPAINKETARELAIMLLAYAETP